MWQNLKNIYHLLRAIGGNAAYGFPGRKMKIIGVTGTDGKTTTCSMIYHILKEAGHKVALISTVSAVIDGKAYDTGFHRTTPDIYETLKYLKKAYLAGIEYVILETTSHRLHQNQLFGIPFEIGILTNITNEHLDYHKTYDRYVRAKAKLFQMSAISILNKDDKSYELMKKYIPDKKIITYGFSKHSEYNLQTFPIKLQLLGGFNLLNALGAATAAKQFGVSDLIIRKSLLSFTAPEGREEIVYDKDFTVIIDFAHTPNAFVNVLPDAKKLARGRLIHIFGSAAERDTYKRPEMGKISSKYADIIIITAEDPRTEPIEKIIAEIEAGITANKFDKKKLFKISDRKEAIDFAIKLARKGDVVIITGKGHEKSMNYGNGEEPWSEHKIVKDALSLLPKLT